jgi:hypothetical protein
MVMKMAHRCATYPTLPVVEGAIFTLQYPMLQVTGM